MVTLVTTNFEIVVVMETWGFISFEMIFIVRRFVFDQLEFIFLCLTSFTCSDSFASSSLA